MCGLGRIGGKNPESAWGCDEGKPVVRRKKAAWKEILKARDEDVEKFKKKKKNV